MAQNPFQDDHSRDNSWVYGGEDPYSDPVLYQIHPIDASSVAPQNQVDANGGSLYAHALPHYWVTPVLAHSIIPLAQLAHVTPSSSAAVPPPLSPTPPTLAPSLLQSPSQSPANGHRPGTQKEDDLNKLEQELLSSAWYSVNALEPPCGSPECPYIADCYGVRGMSCYTAFVTAAQPAGTFGCWRCHAYSARKIEDAIKHQRSDHFNHKPFLCIPANGTVCGKRFFSHTDLQNHRRRCH